LLIKLLDANQNLSVQVHPKDAYALAHEAGSLGKTEMWYVLHAEPEAKIIFGLKPTVTPDKFRAAIANNTLADYLHALPVKAGDAIFVEAGSIHALLGGTVVAEIQQNSDVTYRVYDWGRVGHDGKPRALHVDKAIAVTNFDQVQPGAYPPRLVADEAGITRFEISRCPYFVVEKVVLEPHCTYQGYTNGSTMEIWGTVAGCSTLSGRNGPKIDLPAIRFSLVPANQVDFKITTTTTACTMLRAYLPN
jgi:mannose-6-phosphate isomerase